MRCMKNKHTIIRKESPMNKVFLGAYKEIFSDYKRLTIISILAGFFSAIAPLISIYFSQAILNEITSSRDINSVIGFIILSLIIVFVSQVVGGLFSYLFTHEVSNVIKQLELKRNLKMTKMEFQYAEDPDIKEMRRRLTIIGFGGSPTIERLIYDMRGILFNVTTIIISILILIPIFTTKSNSVYDSPYFFVAFIVLLIIFTVLPSIVSQKQNKKITEMFHEINHANSLFNYVSNILFKAEPHKEVRLYNQKEKISKSLDSVRSSDSPLNKMLYNMLKVFGTIQYTVLVASMVLLLCLYLFLGLKVMHGNLGIGYIVSGGAALTLLINVMPQFIEKLTMMFSSSAGLEYHYEYMDLSNQTQIGSIPVEKRLDNNYALSVKDLRFMYPRTDKVVLKDVNIDFEVGKVYAIVGENGSGKTTFIKLLTRLYDPQNGEVLLNGISADKYDSQQYFSLFNVVFQDFDLFSFKLGETVAAASDVDIERVIEIFKEVGFYERYQQLEKGLDTSLNTEFDKNGISLSGGEKQKLAIARALYNNGSIFILDEPTAALDLISEFEIYQQFNEMTQGKTSLIISHRLSSCRFSDEILVFDEGRIVQQGSHDTLVNQEGKYQELWTAQAQYYQDENIDTDLLGI